MRVITLEVQTAVIVAMAAQLKYHGIFDTDFPTGLDVLGRFAGGHLEWDELRFRSRARVGGREQNRPQQDAG